jgi:hypothetical protein
MTSAVTDEILKLQRSSEIMAIRKFDLEDVTNVQAEIDQFFPIKITQIESLLERIHEQYPLVDRTEIAWVVKGFFSVLRRKLLNGEAISFGLLVKSFHFVVSKRSPNREAGSSVEPLLQIRVRLRTPPRLREDYAK